MWGLPPPHPFTKKRHIGMSAEWAGMLPCQRRWTVIISTREPSLVILLDTCLWTLPTSLFFSSPNTIYWRMLHCPAAKPGVATGLRERGLLSTAHMQCGKSGVFNGTSAWLYLFIYVIIVLYSYILIYLYRYYIIYLLYFYILGILSLGTVLSLDSLL